ncbi:baculoviral IAP repeat-containing protein 3-like [Lingula anatina]|uniref:Baculoviral IAP repeat-containing protein 3-like n=1 Tax=Lingula anatina TaxID=7574 RepID=A0A1S3HKX2_LINAN|nr:baculoviral IAP repeat-containing protein 3-like [Lingula anatina]|eukprot:XP_013386672.1 baculoviral IAP repeat-containing protein 3-like [Lingula anatina]
MFVYSGTDDMVKCVSSCKGALRNFEKGDTGVGEHVRHFPRCEFVIQYRYNPQFYDAVKIFLEENQFQLENVRPIPSGTCLALPLPARPDLIDVRVRLATFQRWPPGISQRPRELSEAGFYYLGVGDRVKCFQCGGGMCNWQVDDKPWEMHEVWFPNCAFVQQHLAQIQTAISGTSKGSGEHSGNKIETFENHFAVSADLDNKSTPQLPSNSTAKPSKKKQKVDMTRPFVRAVLPFFSEDLVRKGIRRYWRETGKEFNNAEELMDYLYEIEDKDIPTDSSESDSELDPSLPRGATNPNTDDENALQRETVTNSPPLPTLKSPNSFLMSAMKNGPGKEEDPADEVTLLEENRRLREEKVCKICLDAEISTVILPCGHLVCCGSCVVALKVCPICRGRIQGTVKTFLT